MIYVWMAQTSNYTAPIATKKMMMMKIGNVLNAVNGMEITKVIAR